MVRHTGRFAVAAWALLGLGACFTGGFLSGQPCQVDADCGPAYACEGGYCGGTGPAATTEVATTETPTSTTTEAPTSTTTITAGTTTGTGGTTTTGEPSSSSESTDESSTGPTCGLGRCKDLDLVVIVDNSPSMINKSNTMLQALVAFDEFVKDEITQACSVHLGVTTTDEMYADNPAECQTLGALAQADYEGNMCATLAGTPYATLADLEDIAPLLCLIRVGAEGSPNEKPIESMLYLFNSTVNGADKCNKGFIRPDSQMVIVMATDEDDDDLDAQGYSGSNLAPSLWKSGLTAIKPEEDLLMIGLLGDDDQNTDTCTWDPLNPFPDGSGAEYQPALRSFFASFPEEHSVVGSLCQPPAEGIYDGLMMEVRDKLRAMCEV